MVSMRAEYGANQEMLVTSIFRTWVLGSTSAFILGTTDRMLVSCNLDVLEDNVVKEMKARPDDDVE